MTSVSIDKETVEPLVVVLSFTGYYHMPLIMAFHFREVVGTCPCHCSAGSKVSCLLVEASHSFMCYIS